jgi:hypothetical protein
MIYSLSQRTTSGTNATAAWEVIAAATNKPKIMELGLSNNAATASVFGLGHPQAIGITPTSPQTFLSEEDGNGATGLTTAAVAWNTGPTVPANFFRRVSLPATIGAGVIWTFPRGLQLATSGVTSTLVLWVAATASVVDAWCVADE